MLKLNLDVDFSPKFVVGHVFKKEKHPNADKLSVCTVDIGKETVQIVCGAPNVDAGQKVVVAKVELLCHPEWLFGMRNFAESLLPE